MADRSPAATPAGGLRGLGPGLTTFLVVDVILVVTFVVLLLLPGAGNGTPPDDDRLAGTATSTPEPETTPEQSAPAETLAPQALPAFVLPSGNIWCSMTQTAATCTILQFSFTPPAPPEGCTGTVGNVLTVVAGQAARFDCVTGPPPPPPDGVPVLAYGAGSTIGEMTCLSSTNGVFCRHNPSGTGFSLARAGTQFF